MNAREHRRQAIRTSATAPAARWLSAFLGALAAAGGCGNSAPHGPPVLQQVYWETHGGVQTLVWSSIAADAAITNVVAPAATQFDLVFDRVIDGSKVEDTVTVNGVPHQQPTAVAPVTVTWPGMGAATDPGFYLSVWYNSVRLPPAPQNSSYVYGRQTASNPFAGSQAVTTQPSSYPSNTAISICINPNGITSQYGEPMAALSQEMSSKCPVTDGPAASWPAVTVRTAPFAAAINPAPGVVPGADAGTTAATPTYVPTNFSIPLQFNNLTVDPATQLSQYVQVQRNGVVLAASEYSLQASATDPTLIFLQPGHKIWDSGAQLDVTLSADLRDIYGATLGTARSASFIPCQLLGEDAGVRICAPPMQRDGGADSGAADAASDVPVSTDAADAGVDADQTVTDGAVD
jgi:hypothetical protein